MIAELRGAFVAERLVRPPLVVPADPCADGAPGVGEAVEALNPDALLFQAAEESLDDPVLLRAVRGDELLLEPVVLAGGPETAALEDQPIVAADNRRLPLWT